MKLLHIDSSIPGENSASRQHSAAIVAALTPVLPELQLIRRDLDADPIPHLDSELLLHLARSGSNTDLASPRSEKGETALEEFLAADIIVIGAPMPTQNPQAARSLVAQVLGIDESRVTLHVMLLGGGFGRRSRRRSSPT